MDYVASSTSLACSKRSDSGERCEVKIAIKSRGGLWREVREQDNPHTLYQYLFRFPCHCCRILVMEVMFKFLGDKNMPISTV